MSSLSVYLYIYIYVCVCVYIYIYHLCVCVTLRFLPRSATVSLAAMDKEVLVGTSGPPSSSDPGEPSGGGNGGSGFGKHCFLAGGGPSCSKASPRNFATASAAMARFEFLSLYVYIYIYLCVCNIQMKNRENNEQALLPCGELSFHKNNVRVIVCVCECVQQVEFFVYKWCGVSRWDGGIAGSE